MILQKIQLELDVEDINLRLKCAVKLLNLAEVDISQFLVSSFGDSEIDDDTECGCVCNGFGTLTALLPAAVEQEGCNISKIIRLDNTILPKISLSVR
jgi:hypothetical protein